MAQIEFSDHLNQLKPQLIGFALKLTSNQQDANDLFQETAYRALKHKSHFQPGTNMAGWLLTIMRNVFINQYRRKKRRAILLDHSDSQFLLQSGNASEMNNGELKLLYDDVKELIEALDKGMKEPFLMHFAGYKYDEIAEKMGLPLGTVKSRIFFARKNLKMAIEEKYDHISIN